MLSRCLRPYLTEKDMFKRIYLEVNFVDLTFWDKVARVKCTIFILFSIHIWENLHGTLGLKVTSRWYYVCKKGILGASCKNLDAFAKSVYAILDT